MEITVAQAVSALEAIESVAKVKMPAKVAYRIERAADKLSPIVKAYRKKNQELILDKYGVKEEGTEMFKVPQENLAAFSEEINGVLNTKEQVEIKMFTIDDFDGVDVTPEFFSKLGALIEE